MALSNETLIALRMVKKGSELLPRQQGTVARLKESGLVTKDLKGTELGEKVLATLEAKMPELKAGIPAERRQIVIEESAIHAKPWITATIGKKQVTTNREILYVGAPTKAMAEVEECDEIEQSRVRAAVARMVQAKLTPVRPHTFQMIDIDKLQLMWLSTEDQSRMIAVQAMYYDFIRVLFPKAKLSTDEKEMCLFFTEAKKGLAHGIIGMVMCMETFGGLDRPAAREDWRSDAKALSDNKVSSGAAG